ncbi:MAG TPA: tetratricopeptide repeat protein, partial [Candidatus Saccharimonadales bacterium]|nr:tetratricopeptide repeat protein [Candidatus Saccharimonadales bacterium]
DAYEAGRRLGADLVLDGSLRKEAGLIRVTAQLRDLSSREIVWAGIIDRPLEGVFELQDEIAEKIARALEIRLTLNEKAQIARAPTSSLRAYDLYLRGRALSRRRTEAGLQRAAALYEQALRMDPDFALAQAGLADAYSISLMFGWNLGEGSRERAKEASRKAIELDPTLPEAHVSMGLVAALDGDLDGGIRRLQHAVSLEPESAVTHHWLSMLYKRKGDYEAAETEGRLALALDPDFSLARVNLAHVAILRGRPAEAEARMRSLLEEDPNAAYARVLLAWAQIRQGEARQAVETLVQADRATPDDPLVSGLMGMALLAAGEGRAAVEEAKRAAALASGRPSPMADYAIACVHAQTGSSEEALIYLARALDGGRQSLSSVINAAYVRSDPVLAPLHGDPRFQRMVASF